MSAVEPLGALALIDLEDPHGAAWEFLLIFVVLLVGPALMRRAAIPGIVGLLIGGYAIGPHGFGWIPEGNTTVPELGQLGLLYLMFVAGVELDLNLLRRFKRAAIGFGLLTFSVPMATGIAAGLVLGWSVAAAILLGSMIASYTLLVYPIVREARLTSNPAAASVVGATVLADTLALVVLAAIAGSVQSDGGIGAVAVQIVFGLATLLVFCFALLPRIAELAFERIGSERTVRYVVALAVLLAAATLAEVVGIEGIVGAFFAGLALNRLVPNEGSLMERIDFFGGAVFIPIFLVSVGLILDPAVMVQAETLGIAGLLIVACLGGKAVAALLSRPLLGFSWREAVLAFAISTPQAAATLATVVVGLQIGLFSNTVVNATLVLILVSVIVSTLTAARVVRRIEPEPERRAPGARVVVAVDDPEAAPAALEAAARVARHDGGVVLPTLLLHESAPPPTPDLEERLQGLVHDAGIDADVTISIERTLLHGAVHVGLATRATLVLVAGVDGEPDDRPAALVDGRATVVAAPVDGSPPAADEQGRMLVAIVPAPVRATAAAVGG